MKNREINIIDENKDEELFDFEPTDEELRALDEEGLSIEHVEKSSTDDVMGDDVRTYLDDISGFEVCIPSEEREYFERIYLNDKKAKDEFATRNLRLVVSVAKRYVNRGLLFLDLIQEGNLGLIKAIEKFDVSRGYKFSTYATWWIRQAILRAINDHGRTIRIPVHMCEEINKYLRTANNFEQDNGRKPTYKEVAEIMKISHDKAREIEKLTIDPISLYTPVGDDEDTSLVDFIGDDDKDVEITVMNRDLRDQIDRALNTLSSRESTVIKMRFGLDDGRIKTLEEIGTYMGVTRERIRQIEAKALRKLRNPSRGLKVLIS